MPFQLDRDPRNDRSAPAQSARRATVPVVAVMASLLLAGCSSTPVKMAADTRSPGCSPLELLRKAGRICCDASTFEATGSVTARTFKPDGQGTRHFRWVFGPNGEYRFECGPSFVLFDAKYVLSRRGIFDEPVAVAIPDDVLHSNLPHNRCHADMPMAVGFCGDLERYPSRMASARLFGGEWTAFAFPEDMAFVFEANENVNGHDCWKVFGRSTQNKQQTTLWVDMTLGVVRNLDSVYDDCQVTIRYDTIRINPTLRGDEFYIPEAAKKKADEKN